MQEKLSILTLGSRLGTWLQPIDVLLQAHAEQRRDMMPDVRGRL